MNFACAHSRGAPTGHGRLARRRPAAAVLFLLALGGCGQKGPLYVPGHSKDTPWPFPVEKPCPAGTTPVAAGGAAPGGASGMAMPALCAPAPAGAATAGAAGTDAGAASSDNDGKNGSTAGSAKP